MQNNIGIHGFELQLPLNAFFKSAYHFYHTQDITGLFQENGNRKLLIEDEPQMTRFLRVTLQGHGYRLVEADTGQKGLMQAATRNPDVILLDLGLPDMDGLEVTQRIREWSETPVIVLSAREQEQDKIKALDSGADDYLTKPFGAGELLARIRAAIRRTTMQRSGEKEYVFVLGKLRVDLPKRQVFLDDTDTSLPSNISSCLY